MKKQVVFLFLSIALFVVGCETDNDDSESRLVGDISGYVNLYDVNGQPLASNSGVMVSIEGTNKAVMTNDSGRWFFNKLSAGTYTFTFTKQGYGFSKIIGYQLAGGGKAYGNPIYLAATPTKVVTLNSFILQYSSPIPSYTEAAVFWIDSNYLGNDMGILCVSRDSNALASDPLNAPITYANRIGYIDQYHMVMTLPPNMIDLKTLNLPPGTKFYATVCILAGGNAFEGFVSSYYDPVTNRRIYTAPGPRSNIVTAVSP